MNLSKNFKSGFTLIELLVVVAIIGILASVILTNTTAARNKGIDAGVKSNLVTARNQAEIFYNTNTADPESYTGICTDGTVGEVKAIGAFILAAAKSNHLLVYGTNTTGTLTTATCNDSPSAWAAEVPLTTVGHMWCTDSTSAAKEETESIGANTACK